LNNLDKLVNKPTHSPVRGFVVGGPNVGFSYIMAYEGVKHSRVRLVHVRRSLLIPKLVWVKLVLLRKLLLLLIRVELGLGSRHSLLVTRGNEILRVLRNEINRLHNLSWNELSCVGTVVTRGARLLHHWHKGLGSSIHIRLLRC